MKIIVTDNNTREVIIYDIDSDRLEWIEEEQKDLSDVIEEYLNKFHHLSNISWMQISDDFTIQFKSL